VDDVVGTPERAVCIAAGHTPAATTLLHAHSLLSSYILSKSIIPNRECSIFFSWRHAGRYYGRARWVLLPAILIITCQPSTIRQANSHVDDADVTRSAMHE